MLSQVYFFLKVTKDLEIKLCFDINNNKIFKVHVSNKLLLEVPQEDFCISYKITRNKLGDI